MKTAIRFANKETVIQPVGGLILEDPHAEDHVLGATGPELEILVPDGQWDKYIPPVEIQRNRHGDTFMCVSFSFNNCIEAILNKKYGDTTNRSDIFLGVGSGTKRGSGNSKRTVADWARLNGFVLESEYPYTEEMTLDEAYKPLTAALFAAGKKNLEKVETGYQRLADNSVKSMLAGLPISPLQVDVQARYKMNSSGYVIWDPALGYAHEVTIFGYEKGKCWYVNDSETKQNLKFRWDYPFGSPMVHSAKKKMKIEIFKEKGKPALAVKHVAEPSLIAFSGGSVQAEHLFKSLFGVDSFSQIPITEVSKFPYPIKHLINTNPTS
jgi:hypothetical protein